MAIGLDNNGTDAPSSMPTNNDGSTIYFSIILDINHHMYLSTIDILCTTFVTFLLKVSEIYVV